MEELVTLNFAHLTAATFNLKKREVRITLTAFLTADVIHQRETLQRFTSTDEPLLVTVETMQPSLDTDITS